jgi:hypothetical protein
MRKEKAIELFGHSYRPDARSVRSGDPDIDFYIQDFLRPEADEVLGHQGGFSSPEAALEDDKEYCRTRLAKAERKAKREKNFFSRAFWHACQNQGLWIPLHYSRKLSNAFAADQALAFLEQEKNRSPVVNLLPDNLPIIEPHALGTKIFRIADVGELETCSYQVEEYEIAEIKLPNKISLWPAPRPQEIYRQDRTFYPVYLVKLCQRDSQGMNISAQEIISPEGEIAFVRDHALAEKLAALRQAQYDMMRFVGERNDKIAHLLSDSLIALEEQEKIEWQAATSGPVRQEP